jgi:2-hydroxy-3-oxopropionate reductase
MKIAFIGLGIMGRPMAKNLLSAGHELVVVARRDGVRAEFEGLGATAAATPREAAEQAGLVITMLPNSPEVREVALGANGVASAAREGLVVLTGQVGRSVVTTRSD